MESTRALLERGTDPNGALPDGTPVGSWLGARLHVSDDDLLAVATLLLQHGCVFNDRSDGRGTGLLVNLAHRHVPKTLALLGPRKAASECSRALKAIAAEDDIESVRALLSSGADPLWGRVALESSLLDAASRGRTASVIEMLRHVASMTDPKVRAAYTAGDSRTREAFVAAGYNPPPAASASPARRPHELPPDVAQLLVRLGLTRAGSAAGPLECWLTARCGDLVFVDCNSAADGPAYYIDERASKLLAVCGGACMAGCKNCPPSEWACSGDPR